MVLLYPSMVKTTALNTPTQKSNAYTHIFMPRDLIPFLLEPGKGVCPRCEAKRAGLIARHFFDVYLRSFYLTSTLYANVR